jgi:hypothetical protein
MSRIMRLRKTNKEYPRLFLRDSAWRHDRLQHCRFSFALKFDAVASVTASLFGGEQSAVGVNPFGLRR